MISSDSMRGFNDLLLLKVFELGDSYGYEISQSISDRSQDKYIIKETTLYSVLNRLEKNGFLISYDGQQTYGRKRLYYGLTKEVREELEKKEKEWKEIRSLIDNF